MNTTAKTNKAARAATTKKRTTKAPPKAERRQPNAKRSLRRMARRWRKSRPQSDGWWLYREGGRSRVEKILLIAGGASVASDDEWEQATGKPPENDAYTENYWEGTDTDQRMMPGLWMKAPSEPSSETGSAEPAPRAGEARAPRLFSAAPGSAIVCRHCGKKLKVVVNKSEWSGIPASTPVLRPHANKKQPGFPQKYYCAGSWSRADDHSPNEKLTDPTQRSRE